MAKIHVLEKHVAELIAAGEVVGGLLPSSRSWWKILLTPAPPRFPWKSSAAASPICG